VIAKKNVTELCSMFDRSGWKGNLIASCLWCCLFYRNYCWDGILLIYWKLKNLEKHTLINLG